MSNKKTILITGVAGFIGSHIADQFIKNNWKVYGVDNLTNGNLKNLNKKVIFEKVNLNHSSEVVKLIEKLKPEIIFHEASNLVDVNLSIKNPLKSYQDLIMTINLINIGNKNGLKHFIFSSSANVYGNKIGVIREKALEKPTSPYGLTKKSIEDYIIFASEQFLIKYTIFRYFNVYGERQSEKSTAVIPTFIKQISTQNEITLNGGNQTRDFVYVKDIARANYLAAVTGVSGIFNIGCGKSITIYNLAKSIAKIMGKNPKINYLKIQKTDIKNSKASIDKVKKELKWTAETSLEDGLKKTIDFYMKR